ncbi:MAG: hypothetical protein Q9195_006702 [Heterodermia aff. obscurata]
MFLLVGMYSLKDLDRIQGSCIILTIWLLTKVFTFALRSYQHRRLALEWECRPSRKYYQLDAPIGLGLLARIIQDFLSLRFLEAWQQRLTGLGHTFSFWLCGARTLITAEPENVQAILSTSLDDFEIGANRRAGFGALIGNGIFAADGAQWSASRALLRPNFAKSRVDDTEMFENHFQKFLQALPDEDGVAVNLHEFLECLIMDTITDFLFGSSTDSLLDRHDTAKTEFADTAHFALTIGFLNANLGFLGRMMTYPHPTYRRSMRLLHRTIDHYVKRALDQQQDDKISSKYVFIEHLAQRTTDPKVLRNELLSALLGGTGTTSKLLINLLYILARRPDVWEKLRAEALAYAGQPITQDALKKATYARWCLNECESVRDRGAATSIRLVRYFDMLNNSSETTSSRAYQLTRYQERYGLAPRRGS